MCGYTVKMQGQASWAWLGQGGYLVIKGFKNVGGI